MYLVMITSICMEEYNSVQTNFFAVISQRDNLINDPTTFFRRTPPPDNTLNTTGSDQSFISAHSMASVIYLPTLEHD